MEQIRLIYSGKQLQDDKKSRGSQLNLRSSLLRLIRGTRPPPSSGEDGQGVGGGIVEAGKGPPFPPPPTTTSSGQAKGRRGRKEKVAIYRSTSSALFRGIESEGESEGEEVHNTLAIIPATCTTAPLPQIW